MQAFALKKDVVDNVVCKIVAFHLSPNELNGVHTKLQKSRGIKKKEK